MNNNFVLLASILFNYAGFSQQIKDAVVPEAVKIKFASIYPMDKNVQWEKENDHYEAGFKQQRTGISVLFDSKGNLVQTETEIEPSALPSAVLTYVSKILKGKNISEAAKIVASTGIVTYEAEIGDIDYLFDAQGNFINSATEAGDENEEKD